MNIIISEEKTIEFTVNVSGISPNDLRGSFRFMFEGIEYGFPVSVDSGGVIFVNIPPLKQFINEYKIKKGTKLESRLDIIANDTILTPWKGELIVEIPLKVEAKIKDEKETMIKEEKKPKFTLVDIKEKKVEENIVEEKIKPKKKSKFAINLENIK